MQPLFLYLYANSEQSMNFNWYLFPFAFLYRIVVSLRNILFNIGVLKSRSFDLPIISVGNITVGGTGKTPHVEYLIRLLKDEFKLATLSRGYKRKTKGFILASNSSDVKAIGDEPKQIKQKFRDIKVAVDEKRVHGVQELLKLDDSPELILLDDAYQHRHIKPGLNILLIDYNRLISKDSMLPVGRLREPAHNHSRANIILMTKCPSGLKPIDFQILHQDLKLFPYQNLFFTSFKYNTLISVFNQKPSIELGSLKGKTALVVTGIANPKPLYAELDKHKVVMNEMAFPDHHAFSLADVQKIVSQYVDIQAREKLIICTEKDAIRLREYGNKTNLVNLPVYYLPIEVEFLNNGESEFQCLVKDFIRKKTR